MTALLRKIGAGWVTANVLIGVYGAGVFTGLIAAAALTVAFAVGVNLPGLLR